MALITVPIIKSGNTFFPFVMSTDKYYATGGLMQTLNTDNYIVMGMESIRNHSGPVQPISSPPTFPVVPQVVNALHIKAKGNGADLWLNTTEAMYNSLIAATELSVDPVKLITLPGSGDHYNTLPTDVYVGVTPVAGDVFVWLTNPIVGKVMKIQNLAHTAGNVSVLPQAGASFINGVSYVSLATYSATNYCGTFQYISPTLISIQ